MPAEQLLATSIATPPDSLLRLEQVMDITSLCRSHIFLLMKKGNFPASITVGVRGARWSHNEIQQWVSAQILNARKATFNSFSIHAD